MKKILAEKMVEANSELELRSDYSGRGAYGKTTYAVVAEGYSSVLSALAEIGQYPEDYFGDDNQKEEFYDALREGMERDSMGLGIVFY